VLLAGVAIPPSDNFIELSGVTSKGAFGAVVFSDAINLRHKATQAK
jgi:hypothetical protein